MSDDAYTSRCECGAVEVVAIGAAPITGLRCPSCPPKEPVGEVCFTGYPRVVPRPTLRLIEGGRA